MPICRENLMLQHTVKAFDEEIETLRGLILEMGGLAEAAIRDAVDALVQNDQEKADRVIADDRKLDRLEARVDDLAIRIIALRAPVAVDLRDVVAALKIGGVVERIGDYAKNIARRVPAIDRKVKIEPLAIIPDMAALAQAMVSDVLNAYTTRDADLAIEIIQRDAALDRFHNSIFRNLVTHMLEDPTTISTAAQLLFVSRNLERIGDHATNVAEMVYYSATGEYSRERDKPAAE